MTELQNVNCFTWTKSLAQIFLGGIRGTFYTQFEYIARKHPKGLFLGIAQIGGQGEGGALPAQIDPFQKWTTPKIGPIWCAKSALSSLPLSLKVFGSFALLRRHWNKDVSDSLTDKVNYLAVLDS